MILWALKFEKHWAREKTRSWRKKVCTSPKKKFAYWIILLGAEKQKKKAIPEENFQRKMRKNMV